MRSPFPGMDPWLEEPGSWLDVHNRFIPYLCDALEGVLPRNYVARVTERVLVESAEERTRGIYPDVALVRRPGSVRRRGRSRGDAALVVEVPTVEYVETGLEIRDRRGMRVVTVIELLSPSNKAAGGPGREQYLTKQREVLASDASLVEIDLLRGGLWTVACPEGVARGSAEFDYLVSVSRPERRTRFEIYPVPLDRRLPRIAVPLRGKDPDLVADLQPILARCYAKGRHGDTIDYGVPPTPPLPDRWLEWVGRRTARRR